MKGDYIMKRHKIDLDLITILERITYQDISFDWKEWSLCDAERLIKIGSFVKNEILENE